MTRYRYDYEAELMRGEMTQKLRSRMESFNIPESRIKIILRRAQRGCIFNVPLACIVEEEIQKFLDRKNWSVRQYNKSMYRVKRDNERLESGLEVKRRKSKVVKPKRKSKAELLQEINELKKKLMELRKGTV